MAHRRCGKLLVATTDDEIATLQSYADTARRNGVSDLELADAGGGRGTRAGGPLHGRALVALDRHREQP